MVEPEKGTAATPLPLDAGAGPLVVACVAPTDLRPEVNLLTGEVRVDPRRADLSAPDAAALEYALRVAASWGGRAVAVAAGPPSIDEVLRQAVAVGAGVLRVPSGRDGVGGAGPEPVEGPELAADPAELAQVLAGAIASLGQPALVLCGDRSALRGSGAVPALLAHHLGAAQALGLVSLQAVGAGMELVGERRLDGGWRERLRITAPAVCSVEAAGVRLRRASLSEALAAADAPIPLAAAVALDSQLAVRAGPPRPYRPRTHLVPAPFGATRDRLLALTGALVAHDPPRIVGPIDAAPAAEELLDYLTRHGYSDPT